MTGTTRTAGARFIDADADGGWIEHRGDTYRYPIHLTDAGGAFSATATTVPAVSATGATEAEALDRIEAALATLIRATKAAGEPMPRADVPPPAGAVTRVVIVRLNEPSRRVG